MNYKAWIVEVSLNTVLKSGRYSPVHAEGDTPLDPMGACLLPGNWWAVGKFLPEAAAKMPLHELRNLRGCNMTAANLLSHWAEEDLDFLEEVQSIYEEGRRRSPSYFIAGFVLRIDQCVRIADIDVSVDAIVNPAPLTGDTSCLVRPPFSR